MSLSEMKLKAYKPTKWYDNLVEYPDRVKLDQVLDEEGNPIIDTYKVVKKEGVVYESGTPVEERIMNNLELGVLNNNNYIISTIQAVKDLQLQVLILQATITGGVNGDVFVDTLNDLESIELNRGIYDEVESALYCIDSQGERLELNGYAIAIG